MLLSSVRLGIAGLLLVSSVVLAVCTLWGWGLLFFSMGLIVLLTFFFNENVIIALYFLRKENTPKAENYLNKIQDYKKQLYKKQYGYYHLLQGLITVQKAPLQSEKYFKLALQLGMYLSHNIALAKLNLAGIAMAKRRKREAQMYLHEADKADKNGLLTEQIKLMHTYLSQMDKQGVRYTHRRS